MSASAFLGGRGVCLWSWRWGVHVVYAEIHPLCPVHAGIHATVLLPTNEVCKGYVFTRVCHSVHRGCLSQCMLGYHPPGADPTRSKPPSPGADPPQQITPPEQTSPQDQAPPGAETPREQTTPPAQFMLGDTVNKPAVCILL